MYAATDAAQLAQATLRNDIQNIGKTIETCLGRARDVRTRLFGTAPESISKAPSAPREDCVASDVSALFETANELQAIS